MELTLSSPCSRSAPPFSSQAFAHLDFFPSNNLVIWTHDSGLLCLAKWLWRQWVPGNSSLPGNDMCAELAWRGALLLLSAVPCSLSPLTSRIHSSLFSDWRRIVSSKFFDAQVPSVCTEELVLPRHVVVSFLIFAVTVTAFA